MDYHAVSKNYNYADCVATENAYRIMLSTQSGLVNCTCTWLRLWKSCLRVGQDWEGKQIISPAGGIVRDFSSFWISVTFFLLFVQFTRMLFSPFGDHFWDCHSQESKHIGSNKDAIPGYASLRVSPGCLALLAGILRSGVSAAVCTVIPRQNVAAETQPLDE